MSIELLAKQGRSRVYGGLAAVDASQLQHIRNAGLRGCFARMDEAPYRMEFEATIHGKEFVNDASARSVNATWYALDHSRVGVIWIVMGGDMEADYSSLRQVVLRKVSMIICVGKAGNNLKGMFGDIIPNIEEVPTLSEAVNRACYCTLDQVQVLFSPATRLGLPTPELGRQFRAEVNEL